MEVVTVVPPAGLPVTAAEVAAFGRIDDSTDAAIPTFIQAATEAAESYTRRSFVTRTLRAWLDHASRRSEWTPGYYQLPVDYFDGALLTEYTLPRGPVISVTGVLTYDAAGLSTAFTGFDPYGDRFALNTSWPGALRSTRAAAIDYTAGYGSAADVPAPIRMAIMTHAALLHDTRGGCGCDLPPACQQMLNPYRIEAL